MAEIEKTLPSPATPFLAQSLCPALTTYFLVTFGTHRVQNLLGFLSKKRLSEVHILLETFLRPQMIVR